MKSRHPAMGWRLFRIGGRSSALILIVLCVRNSLMNPLSPRVGRLRAGDEDEIAARPGAKRQFHCNERFAACDGGMQVHYCRFCIYVPLFSSTRHMMSTQNRGLLIGNAEYGGRGERGRGTQLHFVSVCSCVPYAPALFGCGAAFWKHKPAGFRQFAGMVFSVGDVPAGGAWDANAFPAIVHFRPADFTRIVRESSGL